MPKSTVEQVENALRKAGRPLSVDELCLEVLGRHGARERGIVRLSLHRLDRRGVLVRNPRTYTVT